MSRTGTPVKIPPEVAEAVSSSSRIAAIVLAAGLSQRMGRFKPLLPFGDRPLIAHVLDSVLAGASARPVVVVTGHHAELLEPVLAKYPVRAVRNPAYADGGMLSSIQAGLTTLSGQADAALIVLGDQPMVQPGTLSALISAWRDASPRPRIVLPTCGGRHGHPILLAAEGFADVLALPTFQSLRSYTNQQRERTLDVHVDDPSILHDLDTPDDYAVALRRWQDGNFTVRSA